MTKSKASDTSIKVETIEKTSILHSIEIEVDAAQVDKAFERAYRELAKQVRVKGFRPGKVPRTVIERLYSASVAEQLEHTLVSETLADAVEMADVEPVSEPAISAGSPSAGTPFKYTASIEVRPAIELPDLQGLPAIRPEVVVADSEVDDKLEELRNSNAPIIEEEKGTEVAQGHFVTMDFVGRIDGEPFEGGSGQGQQLEIGSGRFIPGFEDQLVGAVAGDDRDVQVSFPEDYGSPEFAGKAASFAVHVVDVRRREVPELDDEFAKDLGDFDSLDALRDRIRADLESTQEREAKETFRTSLMDGLLERAEFDVPPGMVDRQLESQLQAASRRLEGQVDPDAVRGQMERWREDWRPRAERDVREMLLLQAIGDSEGIEVEEEELTARIEELMGGESGGAAQFEELQKDEQLRKALTMQLRDEKVLDFLGAQAKFLENTVT